MSEKQNAWSRLEAIILWAGMTTNSFARHIGLARGENLYQIKRGNNGISLPLAERIVKYFPEIDRMWLLVGEGEMFVKKEHEGVVVPYYNADLELVMRDLAALNPEQSFAIPFPIHCDLAINYMGRAMGDRTPVGSVVLLKKIDADAIIPGSEYVIVTKKIVTLRIVRAADSASHLRLLAVDSSRFDELLLPIEEVESIYAVQGKLIFNN